MSYSCTHNHYCLFVMRRRSSIGVGTNFWVWGRNLNYDFAKQEVANFYSACDDIVVKILNFSVNFPKDINDKGSNSNII